MLAAGEHPPGGLELMNAAEPLQPWIVQQILFRGRARPMQAFGDLDVAVQRISDQVDRVILPGQIAHEFGTILIA